MLIQKIYFEIVGYRQIGIEGKAKMDNANYELKNKDLHLVKADKENFWTLMDLRVSKDQEEFVAPNSVSLAQAYDTRADGKFVQPFGIWDGDTPVGFAMIGHNSEEYEEMAEVYRHSYCLWRFMIDRKRQKAGVAYEGRDL